MGGNDVGVSTAQLVGIGPIEATIAEFVTKLSAHELIVPDTNGAGELAPEHKAAVARYTSAPEIEVYDNLADLILADPIHDVDNEAGWPNLPASDHVITRYRPLPFRLISFQIKNGRLFKNS